jgi:hypothetical protein
VDKKLRRLLRWNGRIEYIDSRCYTKMLKEMIKLKISTTYILESYQGATQRWKYV